MTIDQPLQDSKTACNSHGRRGSHYGYCRLSKDVALSSTWLRVAWTSEEVLWRPNYVSFALIEHQHYPLCLCWRHIALCGCEVVVDVHHRNNKTLAVSNQYARYLEMSFVTRIFRLKRFRLIPDCPTSRCSQALSSSHTSH